MLNVLVAKFNILGFVLSDCSCKENSSGTITKKMFQHVSIEHNHIFPLHFH